LETRIDATYDAKEISRLANDIWHEYYPNIIGLDHVEYILANYQSVKAIKKELEEGYCYYFVKQKNKNIGYFSFIERENDIHISKLYLVKDKRNEGIGGFIIDTIIAYAKDLSYKAVSLNVNRHNINSVAFYKKNGFTIKEEINYPIGLNLEFNDYIMEREV